MGIQLQDSGCVKVCSLVDVFPLMTVALFTALRSLFQGQIRILMVLFLLWTLARLVAAAVIILHGNKCGKVETLALLL